MKAYNNVMARGVYTLLLIIALSGLALAQQQSLGTFEANKPVTLLQSCDSSTYANITKVLYPNSSLAIDGDVAMTKNGDTYSYIFSDTEQLGRYLVYGHCDESGSGTVWAYDFEITYTGQKVSLSNAMIIFALLGLAGIFLVISFFFRNDYWMIKLLFQFMAVGAGLLAVNSARIVASESNALGAMGTVGITIMIVVLGLFFLIMFIYAFIEIIRVLKAKGDIRWDY